jgi:hypothetical protein
MTAPEDVGQAQRRTAPGGVWPRPLNLIHRNKVPNPIAMRVSAGFGVLPKGTIAAPCPLSFLMGWRAANGAAST